MARLLIIEDEAELLHALEQLFVHDGHDVLTAADGEQGCAVSVRDVWIW